MQKKEIDDLNDTIKWFKTARRNNDMACILPDGPMMKNIIKWLEKLREYENRQEKREKRDKSVLVIDSTENCYDCPFGTTYCGELEYEGLCELADCLDCDEILITEEHYDCESKSKPVWCPLKLLPEKKSTTAPVSNYEVQKNLFAAGWNSCIDKIIGEGKDI